MLYGIGPKRAKDLISILGSIEPLFNETPSQLAKKTKYRASFFQQMKREDALKNAIDTVAFHDAKEIDSIFFNDERYPRRLSNCVDAPIMLYKKGKLDLNSQKFVAIVGTRSSTPYGKEICKRLISSFQDQNIVVVSGLAYGIDSYVHRYCLEFNVPTIAVLGHGLDRIYPNRNRNLAKGILPSGALITEFVPGTNPDRENFPKRNRIVAGMCDATIVVESKTTGGSLITAFLANDYNRDVFAFPGHIHVETSQGCNALIAQQKAHLIQSPEEFLQMMGWQKEKSTAIIQLSCLPDLSKPQQQIVKLLSTKQATHVDLISAKLKIPISALHVELFNLKLAGVVSETPGMMYSIT